MKNITLAITGMSCGHCLNAVNRAIQSVDGVEVKSVRIGHAELAVPDDAAVKRVTSAIGDAGYTVESVHRG